MARERTSMCSQPEDGVEEGGSLLEALVPVLLLALQDGSEWRKEDWRRLP